MDHKKFNLTISNVLLEWNTLPDSPLILEGLSAQAQFEKESAVNLFPKVLAVGPDVKTLKPGQYVVTGAPGINLITIDDVKYGLLKEHQIDMGLDQKPTGVETLEADSIKTSKTAVKVDQFQTKASKNNLNLH